MLRSLQNEWFPQQKINDFFLKDSADGDGTVTEENYPHPTTKKLPTN